MKILSPYEESQMAYNCYKTEEVKAYIHNMRAAHKNDARNERILMLTVIGTQLIILTAILCGYCL